MLRASGEHSLALSRRRVSVGLALGSIVILALAGCGRRSGLDPPPSAATPKTPKTSTAQTSPPSPQPPASAAAAAPASAAAAAPASATAAAPASATAAAPPPLPGHESAAKTGFDAEGNPVAAPGQKKPFILDFLLQ